MQTPTQTPVSPPPDLFRKHRVDLGAMEAGKWIEVSGDRFLVASYSAKGIAAVRAELMAEIGLGADEDVPAHRREWVQEQIFGRAILKDAKPAGAVGYVYVPEDGFRIYSDPEFVALRNRIQSEALGDYTKDTVAKAAVLGNC